MNIRVENEGHFVSMPHEDFEEILAIAAEKGARKALSDVGLEGEDAADDIRELRSLLTSLRLAKRTAWQTSIRIVTTGVLLALLAGIALKLKLFGEQ